MKIGPKLSCHTSSQFHVKHKNLILKYCPDGTEFHRYYTLSIQMFHILAKDTVPLEELWPTFGKNVQEYNLSGPKWLN